MASVSTTFLPPGAFHSLLRAVNPPCHFHNCRRVEPICNPNSRPICGRKCNTPSCWVALNNAAAEIASLRREIAALPALLPCGSPAAMRCIGAPSESQSSPLLPKAAEPSPAHARRSYAVPAVGDVRLVQPSSRVIEQPYAVYRVSVITNLGTMMDVLI